MVGLISGHQEVMDLLVIHFKVAHFYMAFALKHSNPNRSNLSNFICIQFIFWIVYTKYTKLPFHFSLRPAEKKAPQKTVVLHLLLP